MTIEAYREQFAAMEGRLPGAELPWLAALRQDALARFCDTGFPGPKVEAWRNTNLNPLRKDAFAPATAAPATDERPPSLLPEGRTHRLDFVNGLLAGGADELPEGVTLLGLAEATAAAADLLDGRLGALSADDDLPLPALNQALTRDGYVLRLARGVVLERPIEIVFSATEPAAASYPRNLIVAESGSRASVIERYLGRTGDGYFLNGVTEIHAEAEAVLRRCKIQQEGPEAIHIATLIASLGPSARLENFDLSLGGKLARSEIHARLEGAGAEVALNGVYLLRGRQHCDNTTAIDHVVGDTNSAEDYRGVLDDRAHAVFQGKITVRPEAQRIDGHQLNKTLLLSDRAVIDSKPELEIHADDVKCSHGATAGELDETGLFYLRSRGIPEAEARQLLMTAFLAETLQGVSDQALRETLQTMLAEWMGN